MSPAGDQLKEGDHVACIRPADTVISRVTSVRSDGTVSLQGFPGRWMQRNGYVTVTMPGAGTFHRVRQDQIETLADAVVTGREVWELCGQLRDADPRDLPGAALHLLRRLVQEAEEHRRTRLQSDPTVDPREGRPA